MDMLLSHNLPDSRMWSRGVDLSHFNPGRRSSSMRLSWGVSSSSSVTSALAGMGKQGREEKKGGEDGRLPMMEGSGLETPPISPELAPVGAGAGREALTSAFLDDSERTAILYVGRVSVPSLVSHLP